MRRTLLVTNDFPPVVGGIQSYLDDYTSRLPADDLVVLASTPPEGPQAARAFDETRTFEVVRVPTGMLLPTPRVRARMEPPLLWACSARRRDGPVRLASSQPLTATRSAGAWSWEPARCCAGSSATPTS